VVASLTKPKEGAHGGTMGSPVINVEVSAEERARLLERGGFFNQA
jgi:hypothetical protein